MEIKVQETNLPGVLLIEPPVFRDQRGFFMETYHLEKYRTLGIRQEFVQDNHSHSVKNVLRGLHYQLRHPQGKLIYVVRGEIFDVAVDIRRGSPTFGQWTGHLLSEENKRQLFIPEGFAHGFLVLSEVADVMYKCTALYAPGDEYGLLWSDPRVGIDWPLEGEPILSAKDSRFSPLQNIPPENLPRYTG